MEKNTKGVWLTRMTDPEWVFISLSPISNVFDTILQSGCYWPVANMQNMGIANPVRMLDFPYLTEGEEEEEMKRTRDQCSKLNQSTK